MTFNTKKIVIGLSLLIIAFFLGRCSVKNEIIKIPSTVSIPKVTGNSGTINNPKPSIEKEPMYIKGDTVYAVNPQDAQLAQDLNNLETDYDRILTLLAMTKVTKTPLILEDQHMLITGEVTSRGPLLDYKLNYERKEFEVPVEAEFIKKDKSFLGIENVLIGGGIGSPTDQPVSIENTFLHVTTGLQFKSGNVLQGTFTNKKDALLTYLVSF